MQAEKNKKKNWDFPGSLVVKTLYFQHRGMQIQSVGGELRSQMPRDITKTKKKKNGQLDKELLVQHTANAKDVEGGESSAERSSGVTGT